jgi:hypothetical protein
MWFWLDGVISRVGAGVSGAYVECPSYVFEGDVPEICTQTGGMNYNS